MADNNKKKPNQNSITFDGLPQAIATVISRLEQIEQILTTKSPESTLKPPICTKELCKFLGVTQPTISRYMKKGVIPYFTIGSAIRFDLDKVIAALENRKRKQ